MRYPPHFSLEQVDESVHEGQLRRVRFFDQKFANAHPPGQVEFSLYVKDASSLAAWIEKHSSTASGPDDPSIYWRDVSNQRPETITGRPAVAFEWIAAEIGTVHATAFFSGDRVIQLEWYADDPSYAPTIAPVFELMVHSVEE